MVPTNCNDLLLSGNGRSVAEPELRWRINGELAKGDLLGFPDWGWSVKAPILDLPLCLVAALALVTGLALVVCWRLFVMHRDDVGMDAPMEIDEDTLPFPGEVVDGQQTVQYFNVKKTKPVLEELCVGFGLSKTGNKGTLLARLRAFSSDRAAWTRAAPTPRRMHRGPKAGKIAKKTSKKKSAVRAEEMFENKTTFDSPLAHLPIRLPTQAKPTQSQSENILQWAKATSVNHPYVNKEARLEAGRARLRISATARQGSTPDHSRSSSSVCLTDAQVGQLATTLSATLSIIASGDVPRMLVDPPPMMMTQPHPPVATSQPQPRSSDTCIPPAPSNGHSSIHLPIATSPAATTMSTSRDKPAVTRTITFMNGTQLEFCADDVRPPPAISFADDLRGLNKMWDDDLTHWGGHSVLNIKGVPIPIVYWKEVYARSKSGGWKPGQWKRVKGSWFEWKVIIQRWRRGSEADFWQEFSDASGQRLTYTAIIDRLAELRKESDNEMASRAKQEYAENFSETFCYKKNKVCYVKVKACDIAKQYRRLKGIDDDFDMDG